MLTRMVLYYIFECKFSFTENYAETVSQCIKTFDSNIKKVDCGFPPLWCVSIDFEVLGQPWLVLVM